METPFPILPNISLASAMRLIFRDERVISSGMSSLLNVRSFLITPSLKSLSSRELLISRLRVLISHHIVKRQDVFSLHATDHLAEFIAPGNGDVTLPYLHDPLWIFNGRGHCFRFSCRFWSRMENGIGGGSGEGVGSKQDALMSGQVRSLDRNEIKLAQLMIGREYHLLITDNWIVGPLKT